MTVQSKRLIIIIGIILALVIIALGVYWFFFRPNPKTFANYRINYDLQGYLFKQTDDGRVFVEDTTFTARNPYWPKKVKDGEVNGDKTSFEYIRLDGFPIIDHETALLTTRFKARNGLFKVDVIKSGGRTDPETGKMLLTTDARYIMFIDEKSKDLLMCQIFTETDGEIQQYFFSPVNDLDYINDIMVRGYTN